MATSRQTPRVWSDAIRGSEILANWFKLGANAVVLWVSIGTILGGIIGGVWFLEGTTSLDRKLWLHHVRNGLGIGGPIADLLDTRSSGERIQVPKAAVQRYTQRSFETVSVRPQESVFLGFLLTVAGTVVAAHFLRQSGRSVTEDRHIRGTTLAPPHIVATLARASRLPYAFTLAGVPLFRDADRSHPRLRGTGQRQGRGDQGNSSTRSAPAPIEPSSTTRAANTCRSTTATARTCCSTPWMREADPGPSGARCAKPTITRVLPPPSSPRTRE